MALLAALTITSKCPCAVALQPARALTASERWSHTWLQSFFYSIIKEFPP